MPPFSTIIISILAMFVSMTSLCDFLRGKVADVCLSGCHCSGIQMVCDGIIPHSGPGYIREITLSQVPLSKFRAGVFCDVSWNNVSTLNIN